MSRFFKPYEGKRPYLFISYAHKQSAEVVDTIRILHENGWRLWYDEGIPAGSDWPANIAKHMQECGGVLFFESERALESPNCYSEMSTAHRLNKPCMVVHLEDAKPDEKWREILAGKKEIPIIKNAEARADAIVQSGFVTRRYHRSGMENIPWSALGLAASLLFFALSAGALWALRSGLWSPIPASQSAASAVEQAAEPEEETAVPEVVDLGEAERFFALTFPDPDQERAIRDALGINEGDIMRGQLAELDRLYICGNMVTKNLDRVSFDENGVCRVNGAPVIQGTVCDLTPLTYAVRLEELGLLCQPLKDISALNSHALLRELSLAGSTVEDIAALQDLPSLETLRLEHTGVRDLSSLDGFARLREVTVSRDMLPVVWSTEADFTVVLVK
jgi:hypothetical protein